MSNNSDVTTNVSSTPNTSGTGTTNGTSNTNVMSAANGDLVNTANGNVIADNSNESSTNNNTAANSLNGNNSKSPNAPAPAPTADEVSGLSSFVSGALLTVSIVFILAVFGSYVNATSNTENPPSAWTPLLYIFGGLVAVAGIVASQVAIPKNL